MNIIKTFFLFILFILCLKTYADKLEKGFEKLKVFDYFAAKEYFEKTLEDETAAAAYGLSAIYSSDKNPFYNPDSARKFILISDSAYKTLKEKIKKNYLQYGITDSSIRVLSEFICDDAFKKSKNSNSVEGYNRYLQNFTSCTQFSEATTLRNEAAFNDAHIKNTSESYKEFIALYPQALQYREAVSKYDELVYEENTSDHSIESYEQFILNFPENPYRSQAEKMIYSLNVSDKTLQQFIFYARKYKGSRYSGDAWHEIYKLSMKDFSQASFDKFKETFPDYPFPEELESDFRLQNYFFLPFKESDKWGYINELGEEMIKPGFEEATFFSDGLAVVSDKGKYGYVNKAGKITINFQFQDAEPFHNSSAVVKKDSLYGLINKDGDFLIQPKYQELSEVSDDIYMAVKNDISGYLHKNGDTLTGFIFDLAGDFRNGYAIVNKKEKFGLLNAGGYFNIEPKYAELVFIGNGLLKALSENEAWGILNVKGDTILPFTYEAIGEFHEHRALVAKKDKCGYVNEQGILEIPLRYFYSSVMLTTGQFQDGFALLKQKYKSVLIDTTGKVISFSGYEDYAQPSEGFIPVRKNKKWGYADMNGKIRIPCKFESAEPFNEGFAIIRQNKLEGLIDTSGNVFIAPLFEDIEIMEKAILVRSNGKSGLLTRAGILLIPCLYDKIQFLSPIIAKAIDEQRLIYINLDSGKIIFNSTKK